MAVSASISSFKQHIARVASAALLAMFTLISMPSQAQWLSLPAPGQSTHSVAVEPTVLAIAKSARLLALGHDQSKAVAFYHPDTAVLLGTTTLPKEPIALAVSDDGTRAYALYESSGIKIAVIDTATRAISSTWSTTGNPVGMVLSGAELLVADSSSDRIVSISVTTGTVTRTKTLSKTPLMISTNSAATLILVGVKNGELQLLDASTLAVTRTVTVGDEIRSLAWWEGGNTGAGRVLAVGKNQNALNLVDPSTGTINRVALGGDPNTVGVEQHNHWAYVGEKDDQIISLIDLIDRALSGYFTIPGKIGSMLFDQQGTQLFVTLNKDDKLLKLDPNQASLISKVGLTKTLKDVAVNSASGEAITISDKDTDFARINLATYAVQTLALPVKADKVVVDPDLNLAIVGTTNSKLAFVNLTPSPLTAASLYPQTVDLDGSIKDMAVDATRNITIAVVSGKQGIRVINNITRTELATVQTSDKYVAVAIHAGFGIAYLATDNKKLSLFNLTTRTITQTINLNFEVEGMAVDPILSRAVLTTKDQDKAWILNLDTLQMVVSLTMAKNPGAVAIQTDTHIAVVASKDDDSLSLIDLNTNTATLNFNRIDKPTGLAISHRYNKVLVVSSDKDDLAVVQLSNPVASISAISPAQAIAGANATTLTVTGARFIDGAVIYFGATPLVTNWISASTLTATIPAALLTNSGTANIRVQNPTPAGGTSASLVFTTTIPVTPAPVLDSVNPISVAADNTAKTFTLVGSNFTPSVVVVIGTQTFATTAPTPASAQVTLPAALFGAAGTLTMAVQTGGGTSNTKVVTITAVTPPAPTLTANTPSTLKANSTAQTLLLTGSNFIAPVSVRFDGTLIAVSPTSVTQLTILIPGTLLTTVKTATLTVDAAGGTSNALTTSIIAPPPEPFLYSSAPATLLALNQAIPVTLAGQNFVSGAVVLLTSGTTAGTTTATLPANFINASQLKITIPAASTTAATTLILKVQNPDGGTSNEYSLPVTAPQLIVSAIAPARGVIGSSVTIYGTGFSATASDNAVTFAGNAVATIQAATTTSITVTVPAGAQTGTVQVAIGARTATTPTFTVGQTPEQDFAFGANAAQVILYQGSSTSVDVQLNNAGSGAYTNLAKLNVSGASTGLTAIPSRPYLSNGQAASVVLKADATAAVGTTTITVTATGPTADGTGTKTATVNVEVRSKANVTGVKGRFIDSKGMGIGGVLVRHEANQVQTDSAGNFLLIGLPAGNLTLRFDATPAHPLYPIWPLNAVVTQGAILTLADWLIVPPPADDKFVPINNATQDQQVTDPRFPGMAITLPAGTTITGWDGVQKTRIAVERLSPDNLGLPLPPVPIREAYQLFFGTPMGGIPSTPIPVTLPNVAGLDPGAQSEIWYFDGSPMGGDGTWKVAGMGTVSADGTTVTTNPGQGIPRFCGKCGAAFQSCLPPNKPGPPTPPCRPKPTGANQSGGGGAGAPEPPPCTMGNPVMLSNGQETPTATDLVLGGAVPISIDRIYNPRDAFNNIGGTSTSLGNGWALGYDIALLPFAGPQKRLVLPGNNWVHFILQADGNYLNRDDPEYTGAIMRLTAGSTTDWEVELTDKTVMKFKPFPGIPGIIRGGPPLFLIETRSPNGKVLNITRQPNGRITSAGTQERSVTMTYGANGFVDEITDPLNRKVRYTYTNINRIETVTDPEGGVTHYGYQPDRRDYAVDTLIRPTDDPTCIAQLTILADPAIGIPIKTIQYPGTTGMTTNTIGPGGRVVRQILADGSEYRFDYQLTGACRVGPANAATPIKKTICTGADGSPCVESYDAAQQGTYFIGGEIIAVTTTDPKGRKRTVKLNAQGAANTSENEQGQPVTYVRDASQRITFSKDVLGRTMRYVYDAKGNVTQTADGIGRLTVASFDANFNKPSVMTRFLENGTPINTTMQYDNLTGNLLSTSNPENNTSSYTYNTRGQVLEATNPLNHKTKFEYNAAGDRRKTIDALNNAVQATHDAVGRSTSITDPLGFATGIQYNNINQPTKLTDALLGETKLAYNTKQQLQSVTDANNHLVESYQYDDMFRVTSRTDNMGATDSYQYDPTGLLKQATDRKGQVISQTYDEQDRPVNTSYADGTVLKRQYDAVGRLSRLTRGSETISYTYDLVDRVTSMVVTANGKIDTISYQYDNLNRLTLRGVNNLVTAYTYDKAGRLRTITHQGQTTTYNWDAASRLTSKQLPNGVTQSMVYDNANRMTQMTYRKTDNTIIEQIGYTFDARGQRTSKTTTNAYPAAEESAYSGTYDSANRLTQLTTKGTGAPATAGGPATDETFNLTYDINGNMTRKSKADGSDTTSYTWDSQNRLVGLTRTGTAALTASFKYDMGNRRIEKTINGETVKFIYDGDQIVGEQKSDGTTTSVLAGLAIDEMIARYSNGQQSTYLTDALGSVIAQLKDDQTVQNQYGYSPYGVTVKGNNGIVDANADDKGNTSQYTARENDGTGLYYYRARYYMQSCGRFISEDPIGLNGGMNLYAYVGGDPISARDPSGLTSCDVQAALQALNERFPDSRPVVPIIYDIPVGPGQPAGITESTRPPTPGYPRIRLNQMYLPDLDEFTANDLARVVVHEMMHARGFPSAPGHNAPTYEEARRNDPAFHAEQDARTAAIRDRYNQVRAQCP